MVNIMNSKPTSSTDQSAIALVTGASSGIGRACAEQLQQLGFRVYGASRRINEAAPAGIVCLPMNVDDEDSVNNGVAQLLAAEQRLDVLVNCAGYGIGGAIEDTTIDEAKAQFETNFFGLLRVCRAVLPIMRQQRSGLIVNLSSLAGLTGIPFQGLYSASKYAIEGLSESLRMEVAGFGVRVALIEPGDFATGFTQQRQMTRASNASSAYAAVCADAIAKMAHDETHGPAPAGVAQVLAGIVRSPHPPLRSMAGGLGQRISVGLKPFLPHRLYERLLMQTYGLVGS